MNITQLGKAEKENPSPFWILQPKLFGEDTDCGPLTCRSMELKVALGGMRMPPRFCIPKKG